MRIGNALRVTSVSTLAIRTQRIADQELMRLLVDGPDFNKEAVISRLIPTPLRRLRPRGDAP